jgi:hypothetical protein
VCVCVCVCVCAWCVKVTNATQLSYEHTYSLTM